MVIIYKILDNETDECYIGSTNQKLKRRLGQHKGKNNVCSSKKIIGNDNYKIEILEVCNENNRNEREQFYISNIKNVVNIKNTIYNEKEDRKKYQLKNKDRIKKNAKIRRDWKILWGETKRDICNLSNIKVHQLFI